MWVTLCKVPESLLLCNRDLTLLHLSTCSNPFLTFKNVSHYVRWIFSPPFHIVNDIISAIWSLLLLFDWMQLRFYYQVWTIAYDISLIFCWSNDGFSQSSLTWLDTYTKVHASTSSIYVVYVKGILRMNVTM